MAVQADARAGLYPLATESRNEVIAPRAGTALVFPHRLTHQGAEILGGIKYVLRTDVMYRRAG